MNAVTFILPKEAEYKRNAIDLSLFPYTVSLKNIRMRIDTFDTFVFSFDYELFKNAYIQNPQDYEHELLIEFVDNNKTEFFSET